MFDTIQVTAVSCLRSLRRSRIARGFVRREDGSAAVEFALIAAPFLALLFAIIETAMVFFAGQTLEAAAADSARLIMTGQAQTTKYVPPDPNYKASGLVPFTEADFHQAVCDRLKGGLFDCAKIIVDVKKYDTFATINTAAPVTNGALNTKNMGYDQTKQGDIAVVSLYYQWPIYVSLLGNNLSNLTGNDRLLVATSVFRVEPY
jgi:Flp pilus assembly protein TadG